MIEEHRTSPFAPIRTRPGANGRGGASAFLRPEEEQALLATTSTQQHVRAGLDLLGEGATPTYIYTIVEGSACRYAITRDGRRQLSALLVPGDVVNIDALAHGHTTYGVRALTALTVSTMRLDDATSLVGNHPGIARMFLQVALRENAILSRWVLCIGRLCARQRLAHFLCELSTRLGGESRNTGSFDMAMTQEQLADMLGLTPVHVNRMSQQLRSEGLITMDGRTLTIPDLRRLQQEGEFDAAYLRIG